MGAPKPILSSLKSNLAITKIRNLELLPRPNPITVADHAISTFICTVLAVLAAFQCYLSISCVDHSELFQAAEPVSVATNPVATFISAVFIGSATTKAHNVARNQRLARSGSPSDNRWKEFLPASDPVSIALDCVALICAPFAISTAFECDLATPNVLGSKHFPLPDPISVAIDAMTFIGAVLPILATLQSDSSSTNIHDRELLPTVQPTPVANDPAVVVLIGTIAGMAVPTSPQSEHSAAPEAGWQRWRTLHL
jgi:hypothetical protein